MSYVVSSPEMLTSAAADVDNIGSAITAASADAAGPTTGLAAAAQDEISTAIAKLFGSFGEEYQAVASQAALFHSHFTQALAAAGNTYAQAETANAAVMSDVSNAVNAPAQTLLGQTAVTSGGPGLMTSMVPSPSGNSLYTLIMGGTSNPIPDSQFLNNVYNSYVLPKFSTAMSPQPLPTPEQFWPVTPQLGNLTFGQSVAQGVQMVNTELVGAGGLLTNPNNSAVVFGYSQSATVATNEIRALMALPLSSQPLPDQLSFVLVGNPNNPVGGLLERFPGFYIPLLDAPFNGATPQSPWHTSIYTVQYDGIADAPQYPLNVVSDLNAFMGYFTGHSMYPFLTATQVGNAVPLPTNGGNTDYYMLLTQNLPLLQPIRDIPIVGPPIADLVQPDMRVLVDLGYSGYGPGIYANVPTPAGLFNVPNPFTVIPDLGTGTVQGAQGALVDIGVLPPSATPTTYPYVPSIAPNLNVNFGQSSTTLLSVLSGDVGSVLELIPPPNLS